MDCDAESGDGRARRFRSVVLPHLDDAYTLALFFLRNQADAEDAVQECYLRALRHFDTYRGPAVKPWLFAILRNVCYRELARLGRREVPADLATFEPAAKELMWHKPEVAPDAAMIDQQDCAAIRRLVDKLPALFREAIVLRELNGLSYREIADVTHVPVGTVMSRLARSRAMLLAAWTATDDAARRPDKSRTTACENAGCAEVPSFPIDVEARIGGARPAVRKPDDGPLRRF